MASHSSSGTRSKHVEIHKIVILGDGGVGKSALTMQFVCNEFLDYHDPTIEDAYQQQARIDGKAAQLDILDTAGQPEFTVMRDQYMRTGEGFIICYSVIDRRSFEEAIAYRELITRVRHLEDIPMVLVGNKCDLENLRKVGWEEGNALASQWDCPFLETSAAVRTNVEETFSELVREIRNKEQQLNKLDSDNGKQNSANGLRGFFRHFFQKKNKT